MEVHIEDVADELMSLGMYTTWAEGLQWLAPYTRMYDADRQQITFAYALAYYLLQYGDIADACLAKASALGADDDTFRLVEGFIARQKEPRMLDSDSDSD